VFLFLYTCLVFVDGRRVVREGTSFMSLSMTWSFHGNRVIKNHVVWPATSLWKLRPTFWGPSVTIFIPWSVKPVMCLIAVDDFIHLGVWNIKLSLYTMKGVWMYGGIAQFIPNLVTRWRWVVSFMLCLLWPWGQRPWYPLNMRLGGPQSWSGPSKVSIVPCTHCAHDNLICRINWEFLLIYQI